MAEGAHAACAARRSEAAIIRLATGFLVLAAICFWAVVSYAAEATAPATPGAPNEASGEDFYKRGYYPEALAEWKKAVEVHKDGGAAFRLGEEYFDAKVVQRDIATALKFYKFGAEHGDARAQMDLGSLYDKGWGVTRDAAEAAKWYEAAARQGMAEAQYNIATMYEAGEGVTKDERKAYMYFLLAVDAGFPQFANKELEKLSKTMAPEDIKQATILAREFKPAIGSQEAVTR